MKENFVRKAAQPEKQFDGMWKFPIHTGTAAQAFFFYKEACALQCDLKAEMMMTKLYYRSNQIK